MNVNATKSSRLTKALNKNNVLIIGDSHARGCADNEIEFVEFLKKLVMMKIHNSLRLVKVLSKYLNN